MGGLLPDGRLLAGVAGTRLAWDQTPLYVRHSIELHAGSAIEAAQDQQTGFSPALAARLSLADGRRLFVKAIGPDEITGAPGGQGIYRREAEIASQLPAGVPFPALVEHWETEGWVALLFEDVDGANPELPWEHDQLVRVLDAVGIMAMALTPSPLVVRPAATALGTRHWQDLIRDPVRLAQLERCSAWASEHVALLAELEASAPAAFSGETLLHFDLRADNIVLTSSEVYIVDWPHAAVGAPWVDLAYFLPSVAMQGGPAPQDLFWSHPLSITASRDDVLRVMAVFTGYMLGSATMPPPPGLPRLREFQLAQGTESASWLAQLL